MCPWSAAPIQLCAWLTTPRPRITSRRYQIAKDEALALDDLAGLTRDRLGKDRAGMDKGVELTVLTTRVNARRQVGEKLLVVRPAREGDVERSRVQTNDGAPESRRR